MYFECKIQFILDLSIIISKFVISKPYSERVEIQIITPYFILGYGVMADIHTIAAMGL